YNDADGNGVKAASGEAGLSGVTAFVDYNGDGLVTAGEPNGTTDASGNYAFSNVRAGSWTLRTLPYSTYQCTQPATTCAYALTLASGATSTGNVFGEYNATSVSGQVFFDADSDGVKEAGEPGRA